MKVLKFDVKGQKLAKKEERDFSGLIVGTVGYLYAQFEFSEDWDGTVKVASFFANGEEYSVLLDETNKCEIPAEVLKNNKVELSVEGRKSNLRIITNKTSFVQF